MRRILPWLICLALVAGAAYWWLEVRAPAAALARGRRGPEQIPVLVAATTTRDVPIFLEGLGTVQASAMVTVKSQVDGKLIEVDFKEGQDVKAGDVLARIDPRSFQAALDQVSAKKRQDESLLANARLDLIRYQKLVATSYTSAQQADTQKALVAQDEAIVAQDQAQIDTAQTNLSYTTITSPVDGRVGIRQVDAGNIVHASDSGGLVVVTTLKPITVLFTLPQQSLPAVAAAMAAGTAEALAMPQASALAAAQAAAIPPSPVAGGPPAATLQPASLQTGDPAPVASPVPGPSPLPGPRPAGRSGPQPIDRGTLTVLDNQVDPATGTIKLKASFPNEHLLLWPGAFVTIRLQTSVVHDAVVVPPVAVQRGPQGAYVYVINDDQTASRRPVGVGHEDLDSSIITSGLKPGERVVVDGAARLSDKAKVTVLQPVDAAPTPAGNRPARPGGERAREPGAAGGRTRGST